ncbi:MAG TPA: sensor histidine kinase N-terminal domain-containing protein, partial [Dissulfurispiraceae bacterium]|nr:sensor histidine kinase N-terminal domain-containing protein [Dissulfurispiraceae bacterium]
FAYKFANTAYDRSLADSARDLTRQITIVHGREVLDLPPAAEKMFVTDEYDKIYFKVIDSGGALLAGEPNLPSPPVNSGNNDLIMHDGLLKGRKLRIASRYYVPSRSPSKLPVLVQAAETLNKRKIMANEILTALVLPQLLLILSASLVVGFGISRGLRPLQHLRREITARSHRDLSPVEEGHAPMEVLPIIDSINALMARLEEAMSAQQRFVSNAAHQLRTPVAGLITQIDLALRHTDRESLLQSLKQLRTSAERVSRLVGQMLDLSKVEPEANKMPELKPLNLTETVQEVTKAWFSHSFGKKIDIGYEGPDEEIMIHGDQFLIKILLDNLLDNALRYSPPGSSVTTKLKKNGSIILSVEDNGPGIPVQERDSVFQRFYRVLGNNAEGSGLGLSIVREIANIHEATVSIDDPGDHVGTVVKITFSQTVHKLSDQTYLDTNLSSRR